MKRAFFVIGPENSGTKMLTQALISAGCYGDGGHFQRMDNLRFERLPARIAFRRSVPHGWELAPDLCGLAARMKRAGYAVTPLLVYRKSDFLVAGQIRVGYASDAVTVQAHVDLAINLAYECAASLGVPLVTVPYAPFCRFPAVRANLFYTLGLPPPTMEFVNMNEKYELQALPW